MPNNKPEVAVIGAGVAGISAAVTLTEADLPTTLFESTEAPGGRLGKNSLVDLGAQYFTVRHPAFRQVSREWQDRGWVAEWAPQLYRHDNERGLRPSPDDIQRLVAVPGMASLACDLTSELRTQSATIASLRRTTEGGWLLGSSDNDEYGPFSAVILATPADAAARLLTVAPHLQQDVARVRMRPCWTVRLHFTQPLPTIVDACFVRDGPLDWLARNSSKPQRPAGECWVLQSTANWAEQHATANHEQVIAALSQAMAEVMGLSLPITTDRAACFWPQARPAEQLKWGALAAPRLNLYVCGDWCLGGRIENAWLSGRQAARALMNR